MPRKSSTLNDHEKGVPDYAVRAWRRNEYPETYYERHHINEEYPRLESVEKNKNRQEWTEKGYDMPRKHLNEQYPLEEDDPNDYETYTYEYKNQTYLKSPKDSRDVRWAEHRKKDKYASLRRPTETQRKSTYDHHEGKNRSKKSSLQSKELYSNDQPVLNHAATKIQAAYRGYRARKEFWKKREHNRRQSFANSKQYKQDEYTYASVTSIVDDASISALATNADPNLGLTISLPYLDSLQRLNILKDLKTTLSYSDDINSVSQLQTETSPNIIILGGVNPPQAKDYLLGASMFVYNVHRDRWFFGGTMPEPRNYHTAAYLNGKIYVIGGYSPLQINNYQMVATQSTFQMSVRSKRWRKRASMHQPRACHGMCIVNDNIVVMGGRDAAGKLLSTIEMYYPKRDQWVLLKSMPEAIMGLSCTVLDGCIFTIGGIVNEGHSSRYAVSNRTYAFDIEKQIWYKAPPLPEPRAFACAATLKREIWLWCGVKDALNEDGFLLSTNSVLVYNPDVSKWEQHTAIGTLKHAAAIAKVGRRIYIFGGMSNTSEVKEVLNENDIYNRETDKYMEGASLPRPLAGSAAVALPIDYIATSDPKWNTENINEDTMNEAATRIQAVYRGYKTRKIISNHKFPIYSSSSDSVTKYCRGNAFVMHASLAEPFTDKWKAFQRVQIEDWPPIPDPQISNSEVNVRFGTLPRGYTVTSTNTRSKVRRYALLPSHADPNLSMMGHLCNSCKRAKNILGLRKVERLPAFAVNLITAPTLQDDSVPVILVMGGLEPKDPVNLSYGKLILRYHLLKNRFEYFGALPEPRNYHAAVYYQENVYVSGGCDPDKRNSGEMVATNTMYCLNIHSSEWVEKAEMHCSRAYHSLIVALGKIFAIGGRDNNGRLIASIEAYDIENNKWSLLRPMTHPRMGMACAVIDDHIWCMGGIGVSKDLDSISYPALSSVISYDIGKDIWITRPPLRCPRAFGSCVVVNNHMWLVGGASKDQTEEVLISMASVDKYYPIEAEWARKTIMSNPRHCAAVVAVDTCIYVLGGISSQEWSPLARNEMIVANDISLHSCESLPVPLTGLAAVAVPPVLPSLRSESLAMLLHTQLTYH